MWIQIPEPMMWYMMRIYTPLKCRQEQFVKWIVGWIPSYIIQVLYIPEDYIEIDEIFNISTDKTWAKTSHHSFKTGHYVINYWNNGTRALERMVLHSSHLKRALLLSDIQFLWAFSDEALIRILTQYIHLSNDREPILDLFLNKENVYKKLAHYMPSFQLRENVTPRVIYILSQCENATGFLLDKKQEDYEVSYYNDDLEENIRTQNEYLISAAES